MLQVLYSCIAHEHDIRLVFLAAFICTFGCFTAATLLAHAREVLGRRRVALSSAAAAVFGAGVWATHFIAELAFQPGLPIAYDFSLTALSMVVAVLLASLGMVVALRYEQPAVGGFIMGAAVAAMHYTGMAALRVPADIDWHPAFVVASVAVGGIGSSAAIWLLWRGSGWRYRIGAAGLLVLAICGLHFVGMAAIVLVPDPAVPVPENVVPPELLAVLVAAVSIGIGMVGMFVSIFEEQAAQHATREAKELRFSREHLARAQRISAVGSIVRDLRTGQAECSDELFRIFGASRGEFDPTIENLFSRIHPDDLPLARRAQQTADAAEVAAAPLEYRIVRPNGEVRVLYREMELALDEDGRPTQRIITFKDITDLRAAQERETELHRQLLHSQKLEALGTLAGGVAHELNNALVPVLALAQVIRDDLPLNDPLRDDMAVIVSASERARDLVKQVLAFGRKQDDQARRVIDLATVVRESLPMLRAGLPSTIRIVEDIAAAASIILGDAGQVQQIIVNLVTNAAQAIGAENGTITLSVGMSEGCVRLSVADTGCGMDEATIDRIFEPFFTTKAVGQGTGLGLAVLHETVASYGGRVEVRSRPGEGTVFDILLPAAAAEHMMAA